MGNSPKFNVVIFRFFFYFVSSGKIFLNSRLDNVSNNSRETSFLSYIELFNRFSSFQFQIVVSSSSFMAEKSKLRNKNKFAFILRRIVIKKKKKPATYKIAVQLSNNKRSDYKCRKTSRWRKTLKNECRQIIRRPNNQNVQRNENIISAFS